MVRAKYGSGSLQHGDISHHAARSGSRFLFGDLDHVLDPNNHYGNPLEYETVTAVRTDGRRITGVARNEDAFSLQLFGQDEELHLLMKKDLREVLSRRPLLDARIH